jgi:antitoxin component of RelBE/YafQ-DinJ toxin-antitoxin module
MIANALIAARVTTDTKQRFAAVARRQGLSESALLKRYVDAALLHAGALPAPVMEPVEPVRGDARVCVRLQPGDMLLLRERAAAREMPASTYVSFLLRAHLRALTPVPAAELAAVKRAVAEIGALGRNINQIARAVNRGETPTGPRLGELRSILRALEVFREHLKAWIRVNLTSWSMGYEKTRH